MQNKKQLVLGILAHVDAGKTTLAESILYKTGSIRKLGRVDHKDAFLDTFELERNRGITIFSKQARFELGTTQVTLLDTPGHIDFSAEMERTLQILDYAVLVISGADGVQSHVQTLWKLLDRYQIPVFLFINKMDQEGTSRVQILDELRKRLDEHCIDFNENGEAFMENLAMCDEDALEKYLNDGDICQDDIVELIRKRKAFPCYFGSALKVDGVDEFLNGLEIYTAKNEYPQEFGAKVYKIARDAQGNRLTYLKITGGSMKVKMLIGKEKIDQIRLYSGAGFKTVDEVSAGMVCAVTGLDETYSGQGLGLEMESDMPILAPVLNYRISLPDGCDVHQMFLKLHQLEEEEPQLHVVWNERLAEIHVQLMGEVQIEVLKSMILERFGVSVEFDSGHIVYKETIGKIVEGVGHFEPLRHYAEVHLLMEPGEPGSGLVFDSACSTDMLDKNWQRLILTHLEEKKHFGVLTGSEITDIKITLVSGRAHQKHTEGGDFRQATYRAIRQGLMQADNILLEPVYNYRLEVPSAMIGRAMADIQQMHGELSAPDTSGEMAVLTGSAPVICMQGYQTEVLSYTKGCGRLFCELKGYEPCHNADEVIEAFGYDADQDTENPSSSVFCTHGAGFIVEWQQVPDYMHIQSCLNTKEVHNYEPELETVRGYQNVASSISSGLDEELEEIFKRTYGQSKREKQQWNYSSGSYNYTENSSAAKAQKTEPEESYLLVDGYNILFAWEELKALSEVNIDSARTKLMDILCNYQGYVKTTLILVFDAYKVEGGQGQVMKYKNIYVVYTKEAETADQYIEKTVHKIGRKYQVTVATSDALEQVIIMGQGARRLSASEFGDEIHRVEEEIRNDYLKKCVNNQNYLFDYASDDMAELMEDVRLGKKKIE